MAAKAGNPADDTDTKVRTSSVRMRGDVLRAFDQAVHDAFLELGGHTHKHTIAAALYRIALAHKDELPQYLDDPAPGSAHGEER
jgi:hypothetical protein